jgi:hypothetical protein
MKSTYGKQDFISIFTTVIESGEDTRLSPAIQPYSHTATATSKYQEVINFPTRPCGRLPTSKAVVQSFMRESMFLSRQGLAGLVFFPHHHTLMRVSMATRSSS